MNSGRHYLLNTACIVVLYCAPYVCMHTCSIHHFELMLHFWLITVCIALFCWWQTVCRESKHAIIQFAMELQNHIINHSVFSRFPADKLTKKTINVYFDFWPESTGPHTRTHTWNIFPSCAKVVARTIRQLIPMISRKKWLGFYTHLQPHPIWWLVIAAHPTFNQENNAEQSSKRSLYNDQKMSTFISEYDLYEEYLVGMLQPSPSLRHWCVINK